MVAVARMAAAGRPRGDISAITGLSPVHIQRMLATGKNKTFNAIYDRVRSQVMEAEAGHRFRLLSMADKAYQTFEDGMNKRIMKDPRDRLSVAQDWMDRCFPAPSGGGATPAVGINVALGSQQVKIGVDKLFATVAAHIPAMKDKLAGEDPDAHLLRGTEALPTPPGQRKTEDAEPLPGPQDTDDNLDLVEMEP